MKGLLKNNVYAVLSNAKLFSAMMLVLGIFVVGIDHDAQIFIIGYASVHDRIFCHSCGKPAQGKRVKVE